MVLILFRKNDTIKIKAIPSNVDILYYDFVSLTIQTVYLIVGSILDSSYSDDYKIKIIESFLSSNHYSVFYKNIHYSYDSISRSLISDAVSRINQTGFYSKLIDIGIRRR